MVDQNRPSEYFLSCDWGTSTLRLKIADRETGDVLLSRYSSSGIQQIFNDWSAPTNSEDRLSFYLTSLKNEIENLSNESGEKLNDIPVVISGMASSSIGMRELPYASLPLSLESPDLETLRIDRTDGFPHDILLISGICSSDDIMRGEETQLLGLADRYDIENSICVLIGTHSKHVHVRNNQVAHFDTFMSGELFHLLSASSILKNSVSTPETGFQEFAFLQGVEASQGRSLLNELFRIRSKELLHHTSKEENHDYLSGLIIGTELEALADPAADPLFLVGGGDLQSYYSSALRFLNINHRTVPETDDLVVLGQRLILKIIET